MGNNTSTTQDKGIIDNEKSFAQTMETIAEKYILTQNFQDLLKLNDPQYCEKLTILTAEFLNENLNAHEIQYMTQKTKAGIDVYENTNEKLIFSTKNELETIQRNIPPLQKKRMCAGISRFFVRISQIYSAIFMSLNPIYVYTDAYGNKQKLNIQQKQDLPSNVKIEKIYFNLCNERLDYLTKHSSIPDEKQKDAIMFVKPDFCSVGLGQDGTAQKMTEQIGLKELEKLYYDVYDYETNAFNRMSKTMKEQYNKDLKTLYSAFTDTDTEKETLPSSIKSFSDIKMKIYKTSEACKNRNNPYNIKHYGTLGEPLFMEYANHVRKMKQGIQTRQQMLLDILKKIFISITDKESGKRTFSIHPELSVDVLAEINKDVVKILIEQYVSCETDYLKGLQIYESIVENKIKKLTESQINNLEQQMRENIDKIEVV